MDNAYIYVFIRACSRFPLLIYLNNTKSTFLAITIPFYLHKYIYLAYLIEKKQNDNNFRYNMFLPLWVLHNYKKKQIFT